MREKSTNTESMAQITVPPTGALGDILAETMVSLLLQRAELKTVERGAELDADNTSADAGTAA